MLHRVFAVAITLLVAPSASAVTLNVSGGQLFGASGVIVDGIPYDVQFLEGTCIDLYNGCETSDFTFQTEEAAEAASQALIDQVLLDGPQGAFDTNPGLTNGVDSGAGFGQIHTPYVANQFNAAVIFVFNDDITTNAGPPPPGDFFSTFSRPRDNTDLYAVWSETVVPEPSTGLLMCLGLVAFAGQRRSRGRS